MRYFRSSGYHPPALLRRTPTADEAHVNGVWRPTSSVVDWLAGEDDDVDEITETQARQEFPAAFA